MAEDRIAAFTTAREQLREYISECDKQIDAALEECEKKVSRLTAERDSALMSWASVSSRRPALTKAGRTGGGSRLRRRRPRRRRHDQLKT
jgi:hypothetical protein